MKTKIFTLLFAIVASIGTMSAEIVKYVDIGDLCYNLNTSTKTAEVTTKYDLLTRDNYINIQGALSIPSTVDYENITYTVTSIGENAFIDCVGMTSITIPGTVDSIGKWAFDNCTSLASVVLEDGVAIIGVNAFRDCASLTIVSFPNSIINIESCAFYHCRSLETINIPNGITSIKEQTFNGCTKLVSVNIPSSVTSIEKYAFGGCGFASFTIPSTISVIEEAVFWKCANLVEVTIPASVTEIKNIAFKGCTNLTKIYNQRITPANAYSDVFDGVDKFGSTLYVPKSSIDMYSNTAVWRDFYAIEAIEDVQAINDVEVDKNSAKKSVRDGHVLIECGDKTYTIQGQEVK